MQNNPLQIFSKVTKSHPTTTTAATTTTTEIDFV